MQPNTMEQKRRRYFRVNPAISQPVLTFIHNDAVDWQSLPVKDISLGGMAFYPPQASQPPAVGTAIANLQLMLPNLGVISPIGVVRRIERESKQNKLVCALEFTNLNDEDDHKLYQYLNNRQRELHLMTKN